MMAPKLGPVVLLKSALPVAVYELTYPIDSVCLTSDGVQVRSGHQTLRLLPLRDVSDHDRGASILAGGPHRFDIQWL